MSWNYRVIKKESVYPRELQTYDGETEEYFEIHEVYYKDDGSIKMYSELPSSPFGLDSKELYANLMKMTEAWSKPILIEKDLIEMFKGETK